MGFLNFFIFFYLQSGKVNTVAEHIKHRYLLLS